MVSLIKWHAFLLHTFTQDARKRFDKASLLYDQVCYSIFSIAKKDN